MPRSIATDSVSARIFASDFFANGFFANRLFSGLRIDMYLRFLVFALIYAAAFPPVSTVLFAARLLRILCNILDKMLHDPKSACKQELFWRGKRLGQAGAGRVAWRQRLAGQGKNSPCNILSKLLHGLLSSDIVADIAVSDRV
jgi:hypothetical protein